MNQAMMSTIAVSCLIGIALSARAARATAERQQSQLLSVSLGALTIALLAVGLVSHTFVRHVLQVTPLLLAGALITRRSPAGRAAALPLLTLWLGLMIAIWLTLSGIVRMVSGRFTGPEVFLTLVIGVACGIGLIASGAAPTMVSVRHRIATSLVFSAFQVGALWLSLQQFAIFR